MPPPPAELFASRIFLGPALRAQPDRRLVDLVRDGYDAAFEEIVRRYRKPLDRFAAAIVGEHSEDVTQDAFSKALLVVRAAGNTEIECEDHGDPTVSSSGPGPDGEGEGEAEPGGDNSGPGSETRGPATPTTGSKPVRTTAPPLSSSPARSSRRQS